MNSKIKTYTKNISTQGKQNSLNFLKAAATACRNHELNFIETKAKELEQLGFLGTEEKNLLEQLETMKTGKFDHTIFIHNLNMVITNINKIKSRLEGFNNKKVINTPQLNMVTGLNTAIGTFTNKRHAFWLSQEEVIRQATLKFFQREAGQKFITAQVGATGISNIAAATAIISQQLAQFIYDQGLMKYKENNQNKDYFKSEQEFIQMVETIEERFNDFSSMYNIESIYGNQNILTDIKELYGIQIENYKVKPGNGISQKAVRRLKDVKSQLNNDNILSQQQMKLMEQVSVNFKYNQSQLSYENELISALAPAFNAHASVGSMNRGTDILLGWFNVNTSINVSSTGNDPVQSTLDDIKKSLSAIDSRAPGKTVADVYIDKLTELDSTLNDLGTAFIFHETTKSYNSLERGRWGHNMNSFSGREMNMFNYINQIEEFSQDIGLDTNQLKFLAYNLSEDAMGNDLINPVGTIMSIFAGIMMFDDFIIIGKEALNDMTFSNVQNIHLYKLQDTYMPASMFLEATYQALTEMSEELLVGNGFTVSIKTKPINYYSQNWEGIPFEDRWDIVREQAKKNTTIHLHFAANFLSMMEKLQF